MKTSQLILTLLMFFLIFKVTKEHYQTDPQPCEPVPQTAVVSCKRTVPEARTDVPASSGPLIEKTNNDQKEQKDKDDAQKELMNDTFNWASCATVEPYEVPTFILTEEQNKELEPEIVQCANACLAINRKCVDGGGLDDDHNCYCRIKTEYTGASFTNRYVLPDQVKGPDYN